MDSLVNRALIFYFKFVDPDVRILPAVKLNVDYVDANLWLSDIDGFAYQEGYSITTDGQSGDRSPTPDLTLMYPDIWGWVYQQTGLAAYKTRGDHLFTIGVPTIYPFGTKQYNQAFMASYRYPAYR
jgi:hypothetical protein